MTRYISQKIKQNVLQRQEYKCAKIKDYRCLLWICNNGIFDEAGYEFDHIEEYSITKNNLEDNIQALCPNCHTVKTKRFLKNKNIFTTIELDNGAGLMDIDIYSNKKRKIF
jgi:5-methylcytosine-specific restriction endonuclease McrA